MFYSKATFVATLVVISVQFVSAQQLMMVDEAIVLSMDTSFQLRAEAFQIDADRLMEKKATHIPDPELILESTTGDFMTIGVQQSFDFPTVYARQKQLAEQQTILSTQASHITAAALKSKVRTAYLEWQLDIAEMRQWKTQDSLFNILSQAADRQYLAGQIDFVEKTYANLKFSEVHTQYITSLTGVQKGMQQIQLYTGTTDSIYPSELEKGIGDFTFSNAVVDDDAINNTPILAYYQQSEKISEKAIQLERSKVFPDFTIGYLNPADKNTPFPLRLRFGLSVPLWFWQYGTSIKAAETKLEVARYTSSAGRQELTQQWYKAKNDALKYHEALNYLEAEGLVQANELTEASNRMFAAGQYDYIKYLTTLTDAFQVKRQYLELVRNYNQALITLQYLIGQ
ncbi:MAG: TolC family protein [Saprospiraceae bacterium]|nr:TolC family protein [Candidatus Opimibacter skivensis]